MGIDPHDSIEYRQRYPEAAQLANVQGEVEVDVLIQKNGQVGDITLTHDIGYGCGEEALRRARLYRNWVPAQLFDSVFDAHILPRLVLSPSAAESKWNLAPAPEEHPFSAAAFYGSRDARRSFLTHFWYGDDWITSTG